MYSIKKLDNSQIIDLAKIRANSFTAISLPLEKHAEIMNNQNEYDFINFYGLFNEENLIGGMRLHDFKMNLLNQKIFAGGVGSVAVDLLHKKEKVALEIIKFFIYHYKERGASMALLYPFRPDFYKKMGFGFGTSINQFKIKPCDLRPCVVGNSIACGIDTSPVSTTRLTARRNTVHACVARSRRTILAGVSGAPPMKTAIPAPTFTSLMVWNGKGKGVSARLSGSSRARCQMPSCT